MNKIQRVSKVLRILFQVVFIAWPAWLIIYWSFSQYLIPEYLSLISFVPKGLVILHPITIIDSVWGFLIGLLPTGIIMTIIYFLVKLFRLYEQGKIFTALNVRYIRNIGITMLAGQIVTFIYEVLISFALTFNNPPGYRAIDVSFGAYDAYNIIIAIMVILISWIMAEGCRLQEDQEYTV